jgi:ABC-type uncharacterized transport system ATPase component
LGDQSTEQNVRVFCRKSVAYKRCAKIAVAEQLTLAELRGQLRRLERREEGRLSELAP